MEIPELIKNALLKLNIQELNEIQKSSMEANREHRDVILLAPTGSGKTLAFLLPIFTLLKPDVKQVQAMILAPSRELALQIEQVAKAMGTGYKITCCYGGHPFKAEKDTLKNPPAIIIGTPGRIADHLRRGTFEIDSLQTLVIDEFDKALEMGFEEEMSFIIAELSNLQKRILTSATKMEIIPDFTGASKYHEINFLQLNNASAGLKQKAIRVEGTDKLETVYRLLCTIGTEATLVFCNHRDAVDRISDILNNKGLAHDVFHGGLEQEERERALAKFRNGSYRILIATDLAARGLDIPEIRHVIHYQLATTSDAYIHRNGRTARMNAEGNSYLILAEEDTLPTYLNSEPEWEAVPEEAELPENPKWTTIYFGGGKKHKISKGDIVGLLIQKGLLEKDDIGLIEVQDLASFAAVNKTKAHKAIALLRNEKIKKQKVKIEISR
jgi:superfamily II DNA/RNA helicase